MPRSPSPSPARNPRRRHPHNHHRERSPSPPPRRSLRPRRAAAASSRPLVDDFFPFPSSPSSSPSRQHQRKASPEPSASDGSDSGGGVGGGGGSSTSDRRRRKLKLVVKLSQLPPDQHHCRDPPPHIYSSDSDGEQEDGSGGEEQFKPPKKRRIEPRGAAPTDRSRHREVGRRSDVASAPRSKRLAVPGMARTTPLPDRKALEMILDKLQKKDTYGVFADPVDPEELPDYHDVIEHPMDFGTVRKKLARNAYRSFEQFEDDVFLICSNAMQYNAPDTIYFRQAHSIQELARKKFQELRDDGISTENQIKSEQKVRPNSCHREPVKKPVLRNSDDDLGFSRKEQVKKPNSRNSENDLCSTEKVKKPISRNSEDDLISREQVKKPISRNSEDDRSSSFRREQVKKSISRNSEDDMSSSFPKEQVKKPISRNSEDDMSSSCHKEKVMKPMSRNSEDDRRSTYHKERLKKPTFRDSKDGLGFSSQKKHVKKPICRNGLGFTSHRESVEKPICTNGEDVGFFQKRPVEKPVCKNRGDDLGYSCKKESVKKPICRDGQDDLGYSCNKEPVTKPVCINGQDALGSDVSAATIASAGDGSNGLSTSQANVAEPPVCCVVNGFLDKDISSPLDEIKSEKTDEMSARDYTAKASYKSIVVDETRRKTYNLSEEQPSLECDSIFDVFSLEPRELITVGLHDEYSYARSLARFAASLGAYGWKIASERIKQALPAEVRFDRGWVGEYEPLSPSILVVDNQSRSLLGHEANFQRSASLAVLKDAERPKKTETVNPKDMSLSLLNRITAGNNVVGVSSPLESPELKPRLFGVTAEPQHRNSDALSLQESQKVIGGIAKTKGTTNEQMRKSNSSSSSTCPLEMALQRPDCSKGASSGVLDMPSSNGSQPKPFFQPQKAAGPQQMRKSNSSSSSSTRPLEMAPQRPECSKGASSGMLDVPSSSKMNGQPKPFLQPPEAVVPQPRNEATWVYHGRPGDGKLGTSDKSRQPSSIGFITKNQPLNTASFAMNASGQKNINDHAKLVGSSAMLGEADLPNKGFDAPRNLFSAFPAAVRENQSMPSAPAAQSWISFGASSESKPAIISPTFVDGNSGWKMPFANLRASDDPKARVVPQFFRQPVQVVRESPVQSKGLVIFPQLVQSDFSRSQGQPQWQGLVPHMQQKPSKDVLRPDLNIGFPSPGSPPARQSSGINLEAQQPDLALQL